MARTVVTRRTRTVSTEGAHDIKSNLNEIASEIGRVRDQARQEVDALEKIHGMLDTGYLTRLLSSISELEERIEELEDSTLSSRSEVERYEAELAQEQDRLAKLWDAYKTQEDEIERLRRDYPLMEEKLFERERTIEALRKDIARLEPLAGYKDDYDALVSDHRGLQNEADHLDRELEKANQTIVSLEDEINSLRELEPMRGRAAELESLLEEERERLAKLYKVYEDLESDKAAADARIEDWEAWFSRMAPSFDAVCDARTSAPL